MARGFRSLAAKFEGVISVRYRDEVIEDHFPNYLVALR